MSQQSTDRNLLMGLLALQTGFVSRAQVVAAFSVWVLDKQKPLDQILLEHAMLDKTTHRLFDSMMARHLELHGHDIKQSLVAASLMASALNDLQRLADPELSASLARVSITQAHEDAIAKPAGGIVDAIGESEFPTVAALAQTLLADANAAPFAQLGDDASTIPSPLPAPRNASDRFRPTRVGPYEIIDEIARGGMGVVYKARHSTLERLAAVKLIRSGELADDSEVRRFQVEAAAAAQLVHPGIVPVYEFGQHAGQHYMALAYIDGQSLWQRVLEAPLPPQEAARLMQQVAEAVHYAHEHGIIHRDLKPQNILVTRDGQARVTDFGLAKRHQGDSSLTATGQLLGTPSYMPPEQAAGQQEQVGPTSDVYSLGATLYCLLTGRPPFQAATIMETLVQVVEHDPVPPRHLVPSIPKDLELICLKCLQKDAQRRYASSDELAADLRRFLNGDSVGVRRSGIIEHLRDTLRKNRDDVELAAWARLLNLLAWLIPLGEVAVWLIIWRQVAHGQVAALVVRAIEVASIGVVLWHSRKDWWPPRTLAARQMLSQWVAFIFGCHLCAFVRIASGQSTSLDMLGAYPYFAILSGMLWFSLGANYWGVCYAFGCVFFLVSMLLPFMGSPAPLVFGCIWSACLWSTAQRLNRLASQT